jgi:DNA-directed RNA polymerase subunit H (RpoH/RPB5)
MIFQFIIIFAVALLIIFVVLLKLFPAPAPREYICIYGTSEHYTLHSVTSGETLQSIADDYDVTPELLAEINADCVENEQRLKPGTLMIRVPRSIPTVDVPR